MERAYIAELTERESEKGTPYWRAILLQDGQRKVAYVWEPAVAKALTPGQEMLVELKTNGSKFPKVVKAEPLAAPAEPSDLSQRDRLICRQVALKAAAELAEPGTAPDQVLSIAEAFYAWLVND